MKKVDVILVAVVLLACISGLFLLDFNGSIVGMAVLDSEEFVPSVPAHASFDDALSALIYAEDDIVEMQGYGLPTYLSGDNIRTAKRYFVGNNTEALKDYVSEDGLKKQYVESLIAFRGTLADYDIVAANYSKVIELCQLINFTKKEAYLDMDMLSLMSEKEKSYRERGIDTGIGLGLIGDAKIAFDGERYSEARDILDQANDALDKAALDYARYGRAVAVTKSFFAKYWLQTIIVVGVLLIISPFAYRIIRKKWAAKKIKALKQEFSTINSLIKSAQEDCFRKKTITQGTYKIKIERYRGRLAEIKHTIPVLEAIVQGKKTDVKLNGEKGTKRKKK